MSAMQSSRDFIKIIAARRHRLALASILQKFLPQTPQKAKVPKVRLLFPLPSSLFPFVSSLISRPFHVLLNLRA